MKDYIEIIKKRRSYYNLSEDVDLTNEHNSIPHERRDNKDCLALR